MKNWALFGTVPVKYIPLPWVAGLASPEKKGCSDRKRLRNIHLQCKLIFQIIEFFLKTEILFFVLEAELEQYRRIVGKYFSTFNTDYNATIKYNTIWSKNSFFLTNIASVSKTLYKNVTDLREKHSFFIGLYTILAFLIKKNYFIPPYLV